MWKIECTFHSSLLFDIVNELIDSIAGVQRYDYRQRCTYYYGNLIVVIAVFSQQIEMALIVHISLQFYNYNNRYFFISKKKNNNNNLIIIMIIQV